VQSGDCIVNVDETPGPTQVISDGLPAATSRIDLLARCQTRQSVSVVSVVSVLSVVSVVSVVSMLSTRTSYLRRQTRTDPHDRPIRLLAPEGESIQAVNQFDSSFPNKPIKTAGAA